MKKTVAVWASDYLTIIEAFACASVAVSLTAELFGTWQFCVLGVAYLTTSVLLAMHFVTQRVMMRDSL